MKSGCRGQHVWQRATSRVEVCRRCLYGRIDGRRLVANRHHTSKNHEPIRLYRDIPALSDWDGAIVQFCDLIDQEPPAEIQRRLAAVRALVRDHSIRLAGDTPWPASRHFERDLEG